MDLTATSASLYINNINYFKNIDIFNPPEFDLRKFLVIFY